jgi:anti-sigma B factor antagonist
VTHSIRALPEAGGFVVELSGDIDSAASDTLAAALASAVDGSGEAPHVIVDLSGANFLDSKSIGILADCNAGLRASGGRLALAGTRPEVVRLFRLIGLEQTFDFFEDRESARAGGGSRAD